MNDQPEPQWINIELAEDWWRQPPPPSRPASEANTLEITITYDPHQDRKAVDPGGEINMTKQKEGQGMNDPTSGHFVLMPSETPDSDIYLKSPFTDEQVILNGLIERIQKRYYTEMEQVRAINHQVLVSPPGDTPDDRHKAIVESGRDTARKLRWLSEDMHIEIKRLIEDFERGDLDITRLIRENSDE